MIHVFHPAVIMVLLFVAMHLGLVTSCGHRFKQLFIGNRLWDADPSIFQWKVHRGSDTR